MAPMYLMPRNGPPVTEPVVVVRQLRKRFGAVTALDGVDLTIEQGQVMALLGPNGAGKTTLVRVLTTLTRPDAGLVRIAGHDVSAQPARVRAAIGLTGQHSMVDGMLTGRENLILVARLRGATRARARETAGQLLERFRLTADAHRLAGRYSGGMRRRLDLAAALVGTPDLVVLDEPTTGLDPQSRLDTWEAVTGLTEQGTTVLLTTQYLEEADRLADAITVIDRGTVVAAGTADQLKATQTRTVALSVTRSDDLAAAVRAARRAGGTEPRVDQRARSVEVAVTDGPDFVTDVLRELAAEGVEPLEVALRRATLDEVFLALTAPHPMVEESVTR